MPESPAIRVSHIETPSPSAEFEQSSLGEGGTAGRPNAISDALEGLCAETLVSRATRDRSAAALRATSEERVSHGQHRNRQ
jgi:CO/xanthine dehydrogenase Mo-binding subunit